MNQTVAGYDACVLYSATLRSFLVYLAKERVLAARWTDRIPGEWTRSVLANYPDMDPGRVRRTRALMDVAVRDCLVAGYEPFILGLTLPDPDDRHVLAAAITAGAGTIVTWNLVDFPPATLATHGVVAPTPDEFVLGLFTTAPDAVRRAFVRQRQSLSRPPRTADELLDDLARCGLTATAAALRPFAAEL